MAARTGFEPVIPCVTGRCPLLAGPTRQCEKCSPRPYLGEVGDSQVAFPYGVARYEGCTSLPSYEEEGTSEPMEREKGLEPSTSTLGRSRSTS